MSLLRRETAAARTTVVAALYLGVVSAAGAIQAWAVLATQGVIWPDEIYQSLEQAHRLVHGYGFIPWEFRDGARSWLWPGLLAAVLQLANWASLDGVHTPVLVGRLTSAALSLASIVGSMRLAERLAGARGALAAGIMGVAFPISLIHANRCLSEVASAPLLVAALLLATWPGSKRRLLLAGALAALACALRLQNGIVLAGLVGALYLRSRTGDLRWLVAGTAPVLVAAGLLDALTWGRPFHSIITNLQFNMSASGTYGVQNGFFYPATLWSATGPFLLVIVAAFLVSAIQRPELAGIVYLYALIHSAIPHKEIRFLLPVVPIFLAFAGAGLAQVDNRGRRRGTLFFGLLLLVGTASMAHRASQLTMADVGYHHTPPISAWRMNEAYNLLLWKAGEQPDLCGIAITGTQPVWVGGYSYLHKDVPFMSEDVFQDSLGRAANYIVAAREQAPGPFRVIATQGHLALLRRDGPCAPPPPSYSRLFGR